MNGLIVTRSDAEAVKSAIVEFWKSTASARRTRRQRQAAAFLRRQWPAYGRASRDLVHSLRATVLPKLRSFHPDRGSTKAEILEAARRMIDWQAWETRVRKPFERLEAATFITSARSIRIEKQRTDPIGIAGEAWAKKNCGQLVTQVSISTQKAIANIVAEGYSQGLEMEEVLQRLRPVIGLTEGAQESVSNKLGGWLETLEEEEAMGKMTRYADHLLRFRAETIARTETAAAASEGTLSAYSENEIELVDWVADPTACDRCIEMEENGPYKISEAKGLLPLHPRCECCWVMALAA